MSRPSSTAFQNRVQRYDKKSISARFCPPFGNQDHQNRRQRYDEDYVFCKFISKKKCPPGHFFRIIYCVFQIFVVPLQAKFNERAKIMKDIFIHYDTPEQYAEAFQNMINAREKWREEIRQQTAQMAL